MVFHIPPMPKPGDPPRRRVIKAVKAATERAMGDALAVTPRIPSTAPTESTTIKWPGHVVDPAWMKAHPEPKWAEVKDWRDFIFDGAEATLTAIFDPKMIRGDSNKPAVMWTPLTHDFVEGLAYVIDRILEEPDFRAKCQTLPGGKVDPQPIIGINELREAIAPELETLLRQIRETVIDGLGGAHDKLLDESDTMVIRSVWEHDIKPDSTASDIKSEELVEVAMETWDDTDFEKEATRRGYRLVKL